MPVRLGRRTSNRYPSLVLPPRFSSLLTRIPVATLTERVSRRPCECLELVCVCAQACCEVGCRGGHLGEGWVEFDAGCGRARGEVGLHVSVCVCV